MKPNHNLCLGGTGYSLGLTEIVQGQRRDYSPSHSVGKPLRILLPRQTPYTIRADEAKMEAFFTSVLLHFS